MAHGTGAINVDACRVGARERPKITDPKRPSNAYGAIDNPGGKLLPDQRWPANVLTDGSMEVLEAFPPATREAIRFFYSPKADRAEREFGMDGVSDKPLHWSSGSKSPGTFQSVGTKKSAKNNHPTVKPLDLMAWLCRLTTPPGGTVLEPFLGSGSTGIAAIRHGFRVIGIEQSREYFEIAHRRIQAAVVAEDTMPRLDREITRAVRALRVQQATGALQMSMFD